MWSWFYEPRNMNERRRMPEMRQMEIGASKQAGGYDWDKLGERPHAPMSPPADRPGWFSWFAPMRPIAQEESGKTSLPRVGYDWEKQPSESEADYQNRLRRMKQAEKEKAKAESERQRIPIEARQRSLLRVGYDWEKQPSESKADYQNRLRRMKKAEKKKAKVESERQRIPIEARQRSLLRVGYDWEKQPSESKAYYQNRPRRMKQAEIKEAERKQDMAKAKAESGKKSPETQYEWMKRLQEGEDDYQKRLRERQRLPQARRGRGKKKITQFVPQESLPVKSAMDQEVSTGPNSADDERILQQMLQSKLDRPGDSFIQDEAEEKENRAMLKEVQEELARRKKAMLLYWHGKLPAKDPKAQAPVVIQAEESAMDHEVIADDKQKLGILGSNRTTKATSNSNSVTIQDDHVDKAKLALAKKTVDEEAKAYASYRSCWEHNCCKGDDCDHYNHKTALSSMLFTHCTPGKIPFYIAKTLQIFSMKLKLTYDNPGGFEFPLSVFGVVAVRDALDSRRNILFSCDRTEAQELTQDEPFLHLTGPSRAILCTDKVYFEIYLRVKGAEDKPLITCARAYGGRGAALCFSNVLCTLEVCLQTVKEALQATIVAVQIVRKEELWPFNFAHGGMVACTPLPRARAADSGGVSPSDQTIVLIESKDREMPQGDDGYLHLSRQVVCVERGGGLDVVMQAYTKSGTLRAEGRLHFKAQKCHMSQQQCIVGRARVIVDVAWSIVPSDMDAFGL